MSNVTLAEIADLVAAKFGITVADMRGLGRGNAVANSHVARSRQARNIVFVLARRHTFTSYRLIAEFFAMRHAQNISARLARTVADTAAWLAEQPEIERQVEEVEQQIDALHERRVKRLGEQEVRA